MRRLYQILGIALILYLTITAVSFLQMMFDRGDIKKAQQFLVEFQPRKDGHTLLQLMAESKGVKPDDLPCDMSIESRTTGEIQIHCQDFVWMVNVVSYQVRPISEAAQKILQ